VEWAGSVETSNTFFPSRLAARAMADAHVVLPTPPLPPKKRMRFLRRSRISTAGHVAQRGVIHSHSPVPHVEFFKKVGIDLEQIDCGRIRQSDQFHETEQHEKVVQFHKLLA